MSADETARGGSLRLVALLIVAAVVALDVLDGAALVHILALGALALVVSLLRVRLAGRHRGLFALASAGLAAQPALHLAAESWHTTGQHLDPGHGWLSTTVLGVVHVLLAGGTVALVGALEWVVDALLHVWQRVLGWILRWLRRLAPQGVVAVCTVPLGPVAGLREPWTGWAVRRGPPALVGPTA